jgi:hypothetical protein
MRCILTPLTLVILCVAAPSAHSWTEPPDDDGARLERFLPLARDAWPGSPCAGREVVHVGADESLTAEAAALAPGPGERLEGMAAPASCEVWLAAGLSAQRFCTVLTHELGHLAGRAHTTVAHDVMNGAGYIAHEPCERDVQPPAAVVLHQELRALLPGPRGAWRVSCGTRRSGERRCAARRGERVRRFIVTQTRTTLSIVPA